MGEDFMLLSSAKFELASASREPAEIDVTITGPASTLILPVASLLPLVRRVQRQEKIQDPDEMLDTWRTAPRRLRLPCPWKELRQWTASCEDPRVAQCELGRRPV
jgi:hypothetical protein